MSDITGNITSKLGKEWCKVHECHPDNCDTLDHEQDDDKLVDIDECFTDLPKQDRTPMVQNALLIGRTMSYLDKMSMEKPYISDKARELWKQWEAAISDRRENSQEGEGD